MWGFGLIALGYYVFGLIGALSGLLAGFLSGRRMEFAALRDRDSKIADAENDLKDAEEYWNKLRNEPWLFSQREAMTGEPDKPYPFAAD